MSVFKRCRFSAEIILLCILGTANTASPTASRTPDRVYFFRYFDVRCLTVSSSLPFRFSRSSPFG